MNFPNFSKNLVKSLNYLILFDYCVKSLFSNPPSFMNQEPTRDFICACRKAAKSAKKLCEVEIFKI